MAASWTLTARWIFPVEGPPLEHGVVIISGERIVAVEGPSPRAADVDLGDALVLPGFVNAHTHLDLSGFTAPLPFSGDFPSWLQAVIAHRRQRSAEQVAQDIRAGLAESLRCGVTLLGDVSSEGASWDLVGEASLRAVVFRELLGLSPERADLAWAEAMVWLRDHPATATCRPGLSPHAPYSVHRELFARAGQAGVPVMTHLAESREELELLRTHRGSFVSFLQRLGVWASDGLVRGCPDVVAALQDAPRLLLAHGNYLDPQTPLSPGATIVYCPRTHAHFGHPRHPFCNWLSRGIRVALGTDSRASNPDLDVLAELRFLHHRYPEVPGATLLDMATSAGAEALGWCAETGSLSPGKSADLIVLSLPSGGRKVPEPHALFLDGNEPVCRVLWRGAWVPVHP